MSNIVSKTKNYSKYIPAQKSAKIKIRFAYFLYCELTDGLLSQEVGENWEFAAVSHIYTQRR